MGRTTKRAEHLARASQAGVAVRQASHAAATGLEALGAGFGEVRACAASCVSSHGSPSPTQARAAAPAGSSQKASYATAAASLEALGAGVGEVRACAASNDYVHSSSLPTQALSLDTVKGRLFFLPLRPRDDGGASAAVCALPERLVGTPSFAP